MAAAWGEEKEAVALAFIGRELGLQLRAPASVPLMGRSEHAAAIRGAEQCESGIFQHGVGGVRAPANHGAGCLWVLDDSRESIRGKWLVVEQPTESHGDRTEKAERKETVRDGGSGSQSVSMLVSGSTRWRRRCCVLQLASRPAQRAMHMTGRASEGSGLLRT
jgi:hypothetical protein